MARPKSNGPYAPLSATYYLDDSILQVGEQAELLFCRCLAFLANSSSDGFISEIQMHTVVGLRMRNVGRRVDALVLVGVLERAAGGYLMRSWLKWNKSTDEIGKNLKRDRERKQAEKDKNSERNDDGIQTDSSPQITTNQIKSNQITTTPKGVVPRTRGTRLTDDFQVTTEMASWARENAPLVDGRLATQKFTNHFMAKSGRDATKVDWVRTWKNWLLNDQERAAERKGKPTPSERARSTILLATDIDMKEVEQ